MRYALPISFFLFVAIVIVALATPSDVHISGNDIIPLTIEPKPQMTEFARKMLGTVTAPILSGTSTTTSATLSTNSWGVVTCFQTANGMACTQAVK